MLWPLAGNFRSSPRVQSCPKAFENLPAGTLEALLLDTGKLTQLLTYHGLSSKVLAENLAVGLEADTIEGQKITITSLTPPTINDDAKIIVTDVLATNGVVHVIDKVLIPPGF